MQHSRYLIVVGGPTASGKTSLAIRLAHALGTVVLSADSRQFFREMSIGTAKPTPEELAEVPHHFIGHLSVTDSYSVGQYERDALDLLQKVFQTKDTAVLVGGSGLYLKAVCEGLDELPEVPNAVREELETAYQSKGIAYLQQALAEVDPEYHAVVDLSNPRRLLRALAVQRASGRPFSSFRQHNQKKRPFQTVYLQPHWPRSVLYRRIDQRVEQMMAQGLEAEARQLLPHRDRTALQTVGYQELFRYFDGELSLPKAVALIQQNSRRYAKRQLTWHRRDGHWKRLQPDEIVWALEYIRVCREQGLHYSVKPLHTTDKRLDKMWHLELSLPDGSGLSAQLMVKGEEAVVAWDNPVDSPAILEDFLLHEVAMYRFDYTLHLCTTRSLEGALSLRSVSASRLPDWAKIYCPNGTHYYIIDRGNSK